jgi:hypothetical protein
MSKKYESKSEFSSKLNSLMLTVKLGLQEVLPGVPTLALYRHPNAVSQNARKECIRFQSACDS